MTEKKKHTRKLKAQAAELEATTSSPSMVGSRSSNNGELVVASSSVARGVASLHVFFFLAMCPPR